nr:hypothetical protein [Tanacetum cinerariifolium]
MSANDKFGLGYGDYKYGSILSYENEVLKIVFLNKVSDLEDTPVNDRFADGMHDVPPPMIGNYMHSGPDVEIDYSKFTYVNVARQNYSSQAALTSTASKVNTARPFVNETRPKRNFYKTHSPNKRPFHNITAQRTTFSFQKANVVRNKSLSAIGGNGDTAVKASTGCNWRYKRNSWNKVSNYNSGSKFRKSVKDPLGRLKSKMAWVPKRNKFHHTTNGHQFTMSNTHQELASPEENSFCKELASLKQTALGKDISNMLMAEVTPLASKIPILDYKIHLERNKPYFKIIRVDDNHMLFLSFSTLLKNFDIRDLESLWKLVKERFKKTEPKNYTNDYLLKTFKTMFEQPDVEASVWRDQKGRYGLAKIYHLIHFTLEQMLNNVRLEVEEESEMSLELLSYHPQKAKKDLFQGTHISNQERYEHVGPMVTSLQDGKIYKMVKRDYAWLMISRCSRSHFHIQVKIKEQALA